MKLNTLTLILILLCVSNLVSAQTETSLNKQRVMLPNGWSISPAGKNLPLGDLPLNMAVSHNKKMAAVTNNGWYGWFRGRRSGAQKIICSH